MFHQQFVIKLLSLLLNKMHAKFSTERSKLAYLGNDTGIILKCILMVGYGGLDRNQAVEQDGEQ
jgi:hypothetical protein